MSAGNPWMKAVTLTNANTTYNLLALMQAIDRDAPERVHKLQLQADPVFGGASLFRIGNADMTDADYGVLLFSTQAFGFESSVTNSIWTGAFYLRCNAPGRVFCVVAHVL